MVYPPGGDPLLIRNDDHECVPLQPNDALDYVVTANALGLEVVSSPHLGWSAYVPWLCSIA